MAHQYMPHQDRAHQDEAYQYGTSPAQSISKRVLDATPLSSTEQATQVSQALQVDFFPQDSTKKGNKKRLPS